MKLFNVMFARHRGGNIQRCSTWNMLKDAAEAQSTGSSQAILSPGSARLKVAN